MIAEFIKSFTSPRVYWVYPKNPTSMSTGGAYQPNSFENWGQSFCTWFKFFVNLSIYSSPLCYNFILRRIETARQNPKSLVDIAFTVTTIYSFCLLVRALGRVSNQEYREFLGVLSKVKGNFTKENKLLLSRYDFEFSSWPVEFNVSDVKGYSERVQKHIAPPPLTPGEKLVKFPMRFLGWLMINSFGYKMLYPGSVQSLQFFLTPAIADGRSKLVKKQGGERFKLKTKDGNEIDSMFFDRREKAEKGDYIVIASEGNAGFYEMGMLQVALDTGHSVIGWNHPGFWGSTGSPYPSQDTNAADTVMQFVLNELNYPLDKVIIYGWSIGGYPSTWLAMNYPGIKALIIDATFDHVTPLAVERMPAFLESTVKIAVADSFNLNVAEQLAEYQGPLRFIRRTRDEMISTNEEDMVSSNRGNYLMLHMLQHRYPKLFQDGQSEVQLMEYLSKDQAGQENLIALKGIDAESLEAAISSQNPGIFPSNFGSNMGIDERANAVLFLASKYITEYDATHCVPLKPALFKLPWTEKKEDTK